MSTEDVQPVNYIDLGVHQFEVFEPRGFVTPPPPGEGTLIDDMSPIDV